uniref:Uncharacterized protein n=1 Tax=Macrostomum lignano TaxID=282301 RepID=A0A1I8JLS1_9PLAT
MLIEPQHSKSSFAAEAAANSVVFCEIQSCATRSSHSAEQLLVTTLSGTCCEVLPNLSPFPRFHKTRISTIGPRLPGVRVIESMRTWKMPGTTPSTSGNRLCRVGQVNSNIGNRCSNQISGSRPQKNQRPSVAADSFASIHLLAPATPPCVHRNKWASRLDDSVLLDDVTPATKNGRAQRKKRPQSPAARNLQ